MNIKLTLGERLKDLRVERNLKLETLAEQTGLSKSCLLYTSCMKRIVAAPTAGSCGVLPAVLLPLARAGQADEDAVCDALYVAAGFGQDVYKRQGSGRWSGSCAASAAAAG